MSWLKGVKDSANTSKYKGYATGGGVKPETVTADPNSTKVAGAPAPKMGLPGDKAPSVKPIFGKAKKAFKTGGAVKKADGGPAWTGEGDSGKALREQSDKERKRSNLGGVGAVLSSAAAGALLGAGKAPRTAAGIIGAGLASGYQMLQHDKKEQELNKAADTAEGRKTGGRIKMEGGGSSGGAGSSGGSGGESSAQRRITAQSKKIPI